MTNKDIIRKADMALSDIASAGKLNPEQTTRFLRTLIEAPTLIQSIRTVAMNGPQMKINKIGFGSRILKPAVENTALISSDRSKPTTSQVVLNSTEVMAEVRIPYDVLEDNIEGGTINTALQQGGGGLHQTIVDMMAERAALDLEELAIKGDTGSGDAYLALLDGFLKKFSTNVVNAAAAPYSKDIIKSVIKTLAPKYLRDRANMIHFVSVNNETEMRDNYANRATPLGDQQVQGNLPLYVFGSKVQGVPLMPAANSIFTNPMNLIFGIQRNIMMEYNKDITTRQFIIVLTARIAFQVEQEDASVFVSNLG